METPPLSCLKGQCSRFDLTLGRGDVIYSKRMWTNMASRFNIFLYLVHGIVNNSLSDIANSFSDIAVVEVIR